MKLKTYIEAQGLNTVSFGKLLETTSIAVSRYCNGDRIPKKDIMKRIVAITGGQVQPNDFYLP